MTYNALRQMLSLKPSQDQQKPELVQYSVCPMAETVLDEL